MQAPELLLVVLDDTTAVPHQRFALQPGALCDPPRPQMGNAASHTGDNIVGRVLEDPDEEEERARDRQTSFGDHHRLEPSRDGTAWELTCQDLGSRNGTYLVATEDMEQLEPHTSRSIPLCSNATTFFRLGATDAAVCGPTATLLQDMASVSPAVSAPAAAPPAPPGPATLNDLPPEQLAALASFLEAAGAAAALQQRHSDDMTRLPSLQEWAPTSESVQRLPSLQEWARVNSMGKGRPDRMPSVAEWGRLASALGGPEAARRLLSDRAPSLTFTQQPATMQQQQSVALQQLFASQQQGGGAALAFPQPSGQQLQGGGASPVRNGSVRPMSPEGDSTPFQAATEQVGRKRMATPEIVRAAETLMLRQATRPRVQ